MKLRTIESYQPHIGSKIPTCVYHIHADMGDVDLEDGEIAGESNALPENAGDDEVRAGLHFLVLSATSPTCLGYLQECQFPCAGARPHCNTCAGRHRAAEA